MTGRERFQAAFAHEEADRVPIDLAATASSAIEPAARTRLLEHLGREPRKDAGGLEELLDLLEPDLGRVRLGAGGGAALWRGCSVAPPEGGPVTLVRGAWPDPADPARFAGLLDQAGRVRARDRAVVLDTEFGLVDGCQHLRGATAWLEDLLSAPAFAEALMGEVVARCGEILRGALRVLGEEVDAVIVYEDLAGQTRTMMSPELYRRRVKPFHAALVEAIRSESDAKVALHCDGAVSELLPDFVEIGVDALNPVQTSARGMSPSRLKRVFGRDLVLWGGFDAGWALAFGTPQDVEAEVERVLGVLAPGGGYIFAPAYPIDASVPPENVLALVERAWSYRT